MHRLTLGTAGHIDHGKTALILALTGVDTDRLKEEKERGITIDLGFAELVLADDLHMGVVDVPGHEAFVRNMLAGATGVDVVLLVVAADEGVMPQTREHLAIARLLGVSAVVVALTKCDLVDEEWLGLVRDEVRDFLEGTPFSRAPMVGTSVRDGRGLEELRSELHRVAGTARARRRDDVCRLPIDRVFTIRGTGTVVTGTLWSGRLRRQERVHILPGTVEARVRGLQAHGRDEEEANAGERVAVALVGPGVDHRSLGRGQTLVAGEGWQETMMLTVRLSLLDESPWPVESGRRVRVHLGTSESMARVVLLDREVVQPGGEAWAQLRLESPVVARARDHLVLRSFSPVTTIGGGVVAEPMPGKRKRLTTADRSELDAILGGTPGAAVRAVLRLASWGGVGVDEIPICAGCLPEEAKREVAGAPDVVSAGGRVFSADVTLQGEALFVERTEAFHQRWPLRRGIPLQELRQGLPGRAHPDLADALLQRLAREGRLALSGGVAALSGFRPEPNEEQDRARQALEAIYREAGLGAPFTGELPPELGGRSDLRELLVFLVDQGCLKALEDDLFVWSEALEAGARRIQERLGGRSGLGPTDFREVIPLSRRHLLPLLGYYDSTGVTVRRADGREVVGSEEP